MLQAPAHRRVCVVQSVCVDLIVLDLDEAMNRVRRRSWTNNRLLQRDQFSHMPLLREIQENNPDDYRNFLRMTDPVFQQLLALVSPYITRQDAVIQR